MSDSTELTLTKARQSGFWSLIRSTPISLLGAIVLINIIYPTPDNMMFMLFYMLTFGSNMIFKVIAQGIYTVLDTDYIPFIGQGSRPEGAHSCSSFISAPLLPATSFGMPSGHSQLGWFFAVYACLSIIYKCENNLPTIPWGADLSYIPFSQALPVKREPAALKGQRHAGTTFVVPEQKPFPPMQLRESITRTSLSVPERRECTSNWDSAVEWTKNKKIPSCIALILFAFTVSYSRVSIEGCHTTGQVIIGGLIGTVIALIAFWIKTIGLQLI
jgi:membrane-associated phospholipid phosphatase